MESLERAPLVEVVFILRWGEPTHDADDPNHVSYTPGKREEEFISRFEEIAADNGFGHSTTLGNDDQQAYQLTRRLRRTEDAWPIVQAGSGVLTVNQINEGYRWESFKADCASIVSWLLDSHPSAVDGLEKAHIELLFVDGFACEKGQTPHMLIQKGFTVQYDVPSSLLESELLRGKVIVTNLAFSLPTQIQKEALNVRIREAKINGTPSVIMEVAVRSRVPTEVVAVDAITDWLERAHSLQELAFTTLLTNEYRSTFA